MKRLALIIAVALSAASAAAAAPAPDAPFRPGADVMTAEVQPGSFARQKVVYQNDGGPPDNRAYFAGILRNMTNHIAAVGGDVEIRVVSFGPGVQMLVMAKSDAELAAQIDALRAQGVRFLVCRNTLRGMRLGPADLYKVPPEDVVPAGVAELARLQGLGYVLVHP